jgi:hypothetical protein
MASHQPSAVAETLKTWFGKAVHTSSTADCQQDVAYDLYLRRAGRYIPTYPVAAAAGFHEVTELVLCHRSLSSWFLATSASL